MRRDPLELAVAETLALMAEVLAAPREITGALILAWAAVLREAGVAAEDVRPAALRLLGTARFFPSPAEFLEVLRPKEDAAALEELGWQRTLSAVRELGGFASITAEDLHGDGAALWVLSRMGWERLCRELDEENRAIWRAEFVRLYRLAQIVKARAEYLVGGAERENVCRGRDLTPELVGRPDWKALPACRAHQATLPEPGELQRLGAGLPALWLPDMPAAETPEAKGGSR